MSKGYTLNRSDGTVTTINITKVDRLYDSSVQLSGGVIIKDMAAADIAAIKAIIESYSPGGSSSEWHSDNPLCFTAEQSGSTFVFSGLLGAQISYDGSTWEDSENDVQYTLAKVGDQIYLRSTFVTYRQGPRFTMTGLIAASGNTESLIEGNEGILYPFCFYGLFGSCTALTKAPELPDSPLETYCFSSMFSGCIALSQAPELPAATLASCCYSGMFMNCRSLTAAPELPATTLAESCYMNLFSGCTSLVTAPKQLPATSLAAYAYQYMFAGCTALTTAPELMFTATNAKNCLTGMFQSCTLLNYIKVAATTWNTSYSGYWTAGVASSGTFVKPAALTLASGYNGIPSGWTVEEV